MSVVICPFVALLKEVNHIFIMYDTYLGLDSQVLLFILIVFITI